MRRRDLVTLLAGAAGGWPLPAYAQQKKLPVIGFLNPGSPGPATDQFLADFHQGLREAGFVEGQNVAIEYRWAAGNYDRLPALAADLVNRRVDVIAATGGGPAALAAKNATSTIPIVFTVGVDPVASGLVSNLARPGGNLTGITVLASELYPKQLELLSELVPDIRAVALLINPTNPFATLGDGIPSDLQEAANAKAIRLDKLTASTESEIGAAFASLLQRRPGGLLVAADPFFNIRRAQLAALSIRHAIPAIFDNRSFAEAGGLISYGRNTEGAWRPVGLYVGRILGGTKPGDLPVQQPTKFELVVNLTTAKAIGVAVPQSIITRADQVIE
jgi:putative ABC transport system substrate-binding protein